MAKVRGASSGYQAAVRRPSAGHIGPATGFGVELLSVAPLPSWPKWLKPQEDALQWMRIVVRTYEDLLASAAGLDWPPYALDELTRLQRDAGG